MPPGPPGQLYIAAPRLLIFIDGTGCLHLAQSAQGACHHCQVEPLLIAHHAASKGSAPPGRGRQLQSALQCRHLSALGAVAGDLQAQAGAAAWASAGELHGPAGRG